MPDRMIDHLYKKMPWDLLDNVVFDIGDVLVAMKEQDVLEKMFPDPVLRAAVQLHTTRSPYWSMWDEGVLDTEECIEAMSEGDPVLLEPVRRFITGWPDERFVVEEGRRAVLACRRHGKKLYILSNYRGEYYDRNVRDYSFFSLFDGAVISSRVHKLKPRFEIYRHLVDTYRLDPARTLFIDDSPANIAAALVFGMHGFCFNAPGKLSAFIGDSDED